MCSFDSYFYLIAGQMSYMEEDVYLIVRESGLLELKDQSGRNRLSAIPTSIPFKLAATVKHTKCRL